jgi:hypothetical protein
VKRYVVVAALAAPLALAFAATPAFAEDSAAPPPSGPAPPSVTPTSATATPASTTFNTKPGAASGKPGEADASSAVGPKGSIVSAVAAAGFGSLVLAGVSLGVSIGFGAKYLGDRSAAYDVCAPQPDGTLVCPPSVERLHDTAQSDGAVAITTLVLGLALSGLGTTLVIVDASRPRAAPAVALALGPGALALRGTLE